MRTGESRDAKAEREEASGTMEITQEFLKEKFEYREDGHLYYRKSRQGVREGAQAGQTNVGGYRKIKIDNKGYSEHHLIFVYHYGHFPKELDHINRCKTDNHIENLREATRRQNQGNRKIQEGGLSPFKGVSFNKDSHLTNHWVAHIGANGHVRHIGYFSYEVEAARAYDKAAVEKWGEYAYTNEDAGLYEKFPSQKRDGANGIVSEL